MHAFVRYALSQNVGSKKKKLTYCVVTCDRVPLCVLLRQLTDVCTLKVT